MSKRTPTLALQDTDAIGDRPFELEVGFYSALAQPQFIGMVVKP